MTKAPEVLPWHTDLWSALQQTSERLPHAVLLCGQQGTGKMQFAFRLAMGLLCEDSSLEPCGRCMNCGLFAGSNHPDFHLIVSEAMLDYMPENMHSYADRYLDDAKARSKRKTVRSTIVIDQIRSLIEQAYVSSHISKAKVFLIAPTEAMNINSSNSLLKVLEEPADSNYLLLVSNSTQNLLPTIVSRCQKIRMPDPGSPEAEDWLRRQGIAERDVEAILSTGTSPLTGIKQLNDKILSQFDEFLGNVVDLMKGESKINALDIANQGLKLGENECLLMLHRLAYEIIWSSFNPQSSKTSSAVSIKDIAQVLDRTKVYKIYDHVGKLRLEIKDGSLNKQLALEDVLLRFESLKI